MPSLENWDGTYMYMYIHCIFHIFLMYTYMEIHVYSTLAHVKVGKKEKQQYTQSHVLYIHVCNCLSCTEEGRW